MIVKKNNPFALVAKARNEKRNPFKDTLSKQVYAALVDKDDSIIVEYKNESTLKSMRSQLRQLSKKNNDGDRYFVLRDNENGNDFTVYRTQ